MKDEACGGQPREDIRRLVEETGDFAAAYLRWVGAAAADGMSYPHLRVLQRLYCEGPEQMCALAERLGLTARNMTALVDALEGEGLAVRRPHPTDRRSFLVELTTKGCGEAASTYECRVGAIGEAFRDLTADQAETLLGLLRIVRARLGR